MKRIVTLTAAALMITGLTSLGLAHENMTEGKQAPSAQSAPANTTAVVAQPASPATHDTQPATMSGKKVVQSKRHAAHNKKMAQASRPVVEKKETKPTASITSGSQEKKAEPTSPAASTGTNPTK